MSDIGVSSVDLLRLAVVMSRWHVLSDQFHLFVHGNQLWVLW